MLICLYVNQLFPGTDYIHQLRLICEKLGRPELSELDFVTSERARSFMHDLPLFNPPPLEESFPTHRNEKEAMDLLSKLLKFHPDKRISVEESLLHSFMETLHNAEDEPVADFTVSFDFENEELSRDRVQELIWDELRDMHPEIPTIFPSCALRRRSSSRQLGAAASDSKADAKEQIKEDDNRYLSTSNFTRKRSISPPSK